MGLDKPSLLDIRNGQEVRDTRIGGGMHSGVRGVRRHTFFVENGYFSFVDKAVPDFKEAKRVHGVYETFKDAGLPVADFAKTVRQKNKETGKIEYMLAMEDVTHHDEYGLVEVDAYGMYANETVRLLLTRNNPDLQLQRKMAKALAVIHNLGYYSFHPITNIFLRYARGVQPEDVRADFLVLDYGNFVHKSTPLESVPDSKRVVGVHSNFFVGKREAVEYLLDHTTYTEEDRDAVAWEYKKVSAGGIKTYSDSI